MLFLPVPLALSPVHTCLWLGPHSAPESTGASVTAETGELGRQVYFLAVWRRGLGQGANVFGLW